MIDIIEEEDRKDGCTNKYNNGKYNKWDQQAKDLRCLLLAKILY